MTGGDDEGHCWSYWRCSYRRKLIRTLQCAPFLPVIVLLQWFGVVTEMFSRLGCPRPERFGWGYVALCFVILPIQAGYNYYRWQREQSKLTDSDPV